MEIWHNPRCSKSRETKKILDEAGVEYEERRYLDDPPSMAHLDRTLQALDIDPWELVRYSDVRKLDIDPDQLGRDRRKWLKTMVENPRIIQRPVVIADDGRAVIGRPPENVKELLD